MKRFFVKTASILSILGLSFSLFVQCYGKFPLTSMVYKINGQIGSKFGLSGLGERLVNTILMWIPFSIGYAIAMWADLLIMNAIEFWTGSPISIGQKTVEKDGKKLTMNLIDENTMVYSVEENNDVKDYYLLKNRPGEIFEKIDGHYIPVEMKTTGEDDNHLYISYKDSESERTMKVKKEVHYQMAHRVGRMVQIAMAQKEGKAFASADAKSAVY